MKNFKYRLQPLLKVKEHIERQRQKELAESISRVLDQQKLLDNLAGERDHTTHLQKASSQGILSVAELLVISRYLQRIKRDQTTGREYLKVLLRDETARRDSLRRATAEKRKHERLREKQKTAFEKLVSSLEAKEMDETAVRTFRRLHAGDSGKSSKG